LAEVFEEGRGEVALAGAGDDDDDEFAGVAGWRLAGAVARAMPPLGRCGRREVGAPGELTKSEVNRSSGPVLHSVLEDAREG
jgi:hypothetical protein